jgi:hypothetical protein
MKRKGYRKTTVVGKGLKLERLIRLEVNLLNSESVKEVIATHNWCDSGIKTTAYAYDLLARWMEINWRKPRYKAPKHLPSSLMKRKSTT